ncbi:hypothetical protein MASR2M15_28770 [Anaerolineales bacterium]
MELAFISATMRSDWFPPNDPWMSGYAISYYYFGYVIAAMLSMLSGVNSAIGFSMTNALLFSLTIVTSFGLVYNLIRHHQIQLKRKRFLAPILTGLLAAFFVALMSNFQFPLIEVPYQSQSAPREYFDYWGIQGRSGDEIAAYQQTNPAGTITNPDRWSYWWFFRASRVLTDYDINGNKTGLQPIDEFPAFSFILSDNHPHVLALPFVIMVIGLGLNLFLAAADPSRMQRIFYGLAIGGLIFLNTWDGAIYLIVLTGIYALRRALSKRKIRLYTEDWLHIIIFAIQLLLIAFVAYLPFFIGFRSQAGGLLPNIVNPTLLRRYFITFGPLLILMIIFILFELRRAHSRKQMNYRLGFLSTFGLLTGLVAFVLVLILLSAFIPALQTSSMDYINQNGGFQTLLPTLLERRLSHILMPLLLLLMLALVIARLFPKYAISEEFTSTDSIYSKSTAFALILIAVGLGLSLVPEFFYLKDNFGTRINTIFKFYYQVWIVWSIACAYASYHILISAEYRAKLGFKLAYALLLALLMVSGGSYSILAVHSRALVETSRVNPAQFEYILPQDGAYIMRVNEGDLIQYGDLVFESTDGSSLTLAQEPGMVQFIDGRLYIVPTLTLDGSTTLVSHDDYVVIQCLDQHVGDKNVVAVEAGLNAYNSRYARIGSLTGIPILHGWAGHEGQWRGPTYGEVAGSRLQDLRQLYTDLRWDIAQEILNRYQIDYVMFGATELAEYGATGEEKFRENLEIICESGQSRIYAVGNNRKLISNP